MHEHTSRYLRYLHQSLADIAALTPALKSMDKIVELTAEEIDRGAVGEYGARRLLEQVKASIKDVSGRHITDDAQLWPIRVMIMPRVYGLRPEHGRGNRQTPAKVVPLLVFARLGRDGVLTPESEREHQVIFSRELLEPNRSDVSIGSLEAADKIYATQQDAAMHWPDLLRKGITMLETLSGLEYENFRIDQYEEIGKGYAVAASQVPAVLALQRLVDRLRSPTPPDVPLLDTLLRPSPDRQLLNADEQLTLSSQHVGQMECAYGLSASQRESLMHHLVLQSESAVLAVDGPPGAGKTTLLLSAIATLWVKHAVAEGEPPLIVATSTNNQAVTNILRAFSDVNELEAAFSGRWLPEIVSYGLYLPAKTKQSEPLKFPAHKMEGTGGDAKFDAQRFEHKEGLNTAREVFLKRYQAAFGTNEPIDLAKAAKVLHKTLCDQVALIGRGVSAFRHVMAYVETNVVTGDSIDRALEAAEAAQQTCKADIASADETRRAGLLLRADWRQHISDEPILTSLFAAFGYRKRRKARDQSFWDRVTLSGSISIDSSVAQSAVRLDIETALDALLAGADQRLNILRQTFVRLTGDLTGLTSALDVLAHWVSRERITYDTVQQALDTGPRYAAFKWATHYWEARYLLELQAHFEKFDTLRESKSPTKLMTQYRRLAKLHPCFVVTLHTFPDKFIAYPTNTETKVLTNEIDLLIVDEAGQVSPEIGVASFALAKRAIVVGDVDQIEPIWAIPDRIDGANAKHSEVVANETQLQDFRDSGLSAANGSLMRVAQRATPFAKHPDRGRGMFLSEHRRCWPEIIRMCNALVYGDRLLPCREDDGERKIAPSVGYVHIPGMERLKGGSRDNPTEAAAIAGWLSQRKSQIEAGYPSKTLGELVGVVTPFAAQKRRILSELVTVLGKGHDITVGTVHALQGAQRRVVLFSPTYGLGTEPGTTFIDRSPSLLNVAISRAEDAFLVFGNMHLFKPEGNHPCAVIGRMLFCDGNNEISGISPQLLVPGSDLPPGRIIADLEAHRAVLKEALITAQRHVVIVSPFLAEPAILADDLPAAIKAATARQVSVKIISDPKFHRNPAAYDRAVDLLHTAGAQVRHAMTQGVHSKMLLVDRTWLVIGSFNWLSAVRDPGSEFARYESSLRYDGDQAFEMITRSLRDLKELFENRS